MDHIIDICDRIFQKQKSLQLPVTQLLRDGLTRQQISDSIVDLGIELPRSATSMYTWRDGTEEGQLPYGAMWFLPGYYFQSLERAVASYSIADEEIPDIWKPYWFPMFCSGGGDHYVINCEHSQSEDAELLLWLHGHPDVDVIFVNLLSMLRTIDASLNDGTFSLSEDGLLETDMVRFEEHARRFNPGVKYWDN